MVYSVYCTTYYYIVQYMVQYIDLRYCVSVLYSTASSVQNSAKIQEEKCVDDGCSLYKIMMTIPIGS